MHRKKTTKSPDHRQTILASMETLKIKMTAEELDGLVRDATESGMSPWELLDRFLALPASQSVERAIERRIKNAGFPTSASLESFDWEFNAKTINKGSMLELASGEFIKRRDNLAFVGQSGYRSFDLLIIDEFGFDKLERREYPESPSLMYKVVDGRNGRGSTAFLTNVDFGDWTEYFGDPALVMALLDRVSDNAIVFRFEGKSFRKNRTKQAQ